MTIPSADEPASAAASPAQIAQPLVDHLVELTDSAVHEGSVFVAIDGRSGAGKSALAATLADRLRSHHRISTVVIEGDDFYAGGTGDQWDERSPSQKADQVIDWRRQRDVLQDLREHGHASWCPFDWNSPDWNADPVPLRPEPMSCDSATVVVLDGAYSARPQLHDLLDALVLLNTPADQRRRQLLGREGDEYRSEWEGRWSAAEDHYFGTIMPPDSFDLIVPDTAAHRDGWDRG